MRPKPFHVTSAYCRSKLVKVELGKTVDDPEGGRGDDGRRPRGGAGACGGRRLLGVYHDRRSALSEDSRAATDSRRHGEDAAR